MYVCEFADNKIGNIGTQSIGDGLKPLKSLATLDLSGECCAMCVMCIVD